MCKRLVIPVDFVISFVKEGIPITFICQPITKTNKYFNVLLNIVSNILDIEAEIRSKMENLGSSKWRCKDCNFVSKSTNVYYHIESKHVEGAGYFCNICTKFCKTRNALNIHMTKYHKQLK